MERGCEQTFCERCGPPGGDRTAGCARGEGELEGAEEEVGCGCAFLSFGALGFVDALSVFRGGGAGGARGVRRCGRWRFFYVGKESAREDDAVELGHKIAQVDVERLACVCKKIDEQSEKDKKKFSNLVRSWGSRRCS